MDRIPNRGVLLSISGPGLFAKLSLDLQPRDDEGKRICANIRDGGATGAGQRVAQSRQGRTLED